MKKVRKVRKVTLVLMDQAGLRDPLLKETKVKRDRRVIQVQAVPQVLRVRKVRLVEQDLQDLQDLRVQRIVQTSICLQQHKTTHQVALRFKSPHRTPMVQLQRAVTLQITESRLMKQVHI